MITFSWDVFIAICFIVSIVYGFVSQKDRLATIIISAYVAFVVASHTGEWFYRVLAQKGDLLGSWASNLSLFSVTAGLYVLMLILLSVRGGFSFDERSIPVYLPFITACLGFLGTGLILGSIFYFMPGEMREILVESSKMASFVWRYYNIWIILPPVLLVGISLFKGR